MILENFLAALSNLWLLILNVTNPNSFRKPLKPAEEQQYLTAMAQGDEDARQILIEHNLRLVAHIVKKYYASKVDTDDLISIGTIGLIKGIDSYRTDKGVRLSSYISRCIENEVLMTFRAAKKAGGDVSLSEPIDTDKDGNALTLMDVIAEEDTIIDDLDIKMKSEKLRSYIGCLESREQDVINMRYGLNGHEPLTQREVAAVLDISRSYVSRIEKKALARLRKKYS
ncbi:MAG: RNA polymerase sporulation sigma factor SigK [Oscillospiraceae bacterium]|nr:RNA polymerase sporulation sigma factor SigK [Oscillospiraceae bacterium]